MKIKLGQKHVRFLYFTILYSLLDWFYGGSLETVNSDTLSVTRGMIKIIYSCVAKHLIILNGSFCFK